MKCSVPAGFPEFRFAATVLQSSAAQIGVKVEIEEQPFVQAITAIKTDKSNCFVLGNANLSPTDATKFFAAHYLKGGFFNSGKYDDPALEALVAKIPTVADAAERAAMLKQAFETVVDSHYIIWAGAPDHRGAGARPHRWLPHRPGRVHQRPLLGAACRN